MEALHYKVWEAWGHKVRGETITQDNISDPALRHQECYFEIDQKSGIVIERSPANKDDCWYVKAVKDGKNYLIPKRFIEKMPLKPIKVQEVRLKKADTIIWNLVLDIDTFNIPKKPFIDIEKFIIEDFNPVEHSCPDDFFLLKLIAIAPETKVAICANVGCGKQSNLTILRHVLGNYAPKVIKPTQAKLWVTMKNNDYINLDEITSWPAEFVKNIEDLAAACADESPDLDKYSLGRNKDMEILGLTKKSFTFTFNRPDELDKKKGVPFEQKFENPAKIIDRFPRLLFSGKVISHIDKPKPHETVKIMEQNFKEMCVIAAKIEYLRNNYELHMHGWKRDKSIFKDNVRYEANIKPVIDLLDCCCKTQEIFDKRLESLNQKHRDYMQMINCPIKEPEKKDNKGQTTFNVSEPEDFEEMDLSGGK